MDGFGLDAVVFPAVADVGPADMDVNPASADLGWRNGVWVANGNLAIRHLGIPTVTVPMGTMADIGMPVGLTFAGRAYDDVALLTLRRGVRGDGPQTHRATRAHHPRDSCISRAQAAVRVQCPQATTLTSLPATTMTFFGTAPARKATTFSSANAAASTTSASASAATVTRPRTLPLTWTGYSTVSSTR